MAEPHHQNQDIPPPWYSFKPSDCRVIQNFLLPKIHGEPIPLGTISAYPNVFGMLPKDHAEAEGYTEEKSELWFFTEKTKRDAKWKVAHKPVTKIKSESGAIIGKKRKLISVENVRSRGVEWFLDEYTAEGEANTLAMYKLYTGQKHFVPANVPGDEQLPVDVPGDEQLPADVLGNEQLPADVPGNEQLPADVPGNDQLPADLPGNQQAGSSYWLANSAEAQGDIPSTSQNHQQAEAQGDIPSTSQNHQQAGSSYWLANSAEAQTDIPSTSQNHQQLPHGQGVLQSNPQPSTSLTNPEDSFLTINEQSLLDREYPFDFSEDLFLYFQDPQHPPTIQDLFEFDVDSQPQQPSGSEEQPQNPPTGVTLPEDPFDFSVDPFLHFPNPQHPPTVQDLFGFDVDSQPQQPSGSEEQLQNPPTGVTLPEDPFLYFQDPQHPPTVQDLFGFDVDSQSQQPSGSEEQPQNHPTGVILPEETSSNSSTQRQEG